MALNLQHQTAAEFAARYWAMVLAAQQSDRLRFHRLIWWLLARIAAGDITDAGARTTFNSVFGRSLTAAQWTSFKTSRLQPIADRYASYLAEPDL
ncbi:MAG: hypothetical protein NDI84_08000 [Steroidobacteraceae bacterium]|nr:hypothetical protein [Steroidobacteraceae bacterium]